MKDDKLEKQFDEYFAGVKAPEGVIDDAKKYAVKKRSRLPKLVKFASIAASFIIVFSAAVAIIAHTNLNNGSSDGINPPNNSGDVPAPPVDEGDASNPSGGDGSGAGDALPDNSYGDDSLNIVYADPYTIAKDKPSLKIIQRLAFSDSAAVGSCTAGYMDGELAIVKAEVSAVYGLARYDSTVYIEFAEGVYSGVADFAEGETGEYRGITYRLTKTVAENGEPQNKLFVSVDGVKYYFDVISSDENAYLKYLQLLIN